MITVRPTVLSAVLLGIIALVAAAVVLILIFIRYARRLLARVDELLGRAEVLLQRAGRDPVPRSDGALERPQTRDQRYAMLEANAAEYDRELADTGRRIDTAPVPRADVAGGARLSATDPRLSCYVLSPAYRPERVYGELVPAFRSPDPQRFPSPPRAATEQFLAEQHGLPAAVDAVDDYLATIGLRAPRTAS